jgi:DNA-directed RNA polymerase subunit RPC12/RpoP
MAISYFVCLNCGKAFSEHLRDSKNKTHPLTLEQAVQAYMGQRCQTYSGPEFYHDVIPIFNHRWWHKIWPPKPEHSMIPTDWVRGEE